MSSGSGQGGGAADTARAEARAANLLISVALCLSLTGRVTNLGKDGRTDGARSMDDGCCSRQRQVYHPPDGIVMVRLGHPRDRRVF
eukprot:scaffold698_cov127-Isochrysis_galbana.AAC.4